MRLSPITEDVRRSKSDSPASKTASATVRTASPTMRPVSLCGMPVSMIARRISGATDETTASRMTATRKTPRMRR